MLQRPEIKKYDLNIKLGLIISLLVLISLFIFSPQIINKKTEIPYFPEPLITVLDIPQTNQSDLSAPPHPAAPALSSLIEPIDDPEPLGDYQIKESSKEKTNQTSSKHTAGKKGIYEATSFPFVPRQLIEVVPEKVEDAEGAVKLRLLINREGIVKTHNVLSNTLNKQELFKNVIEAVYKSKWQPISFDGEKVEYWIEKTYSFN